MPDTSLVDGKLNLGTSTTLVGSEGEFYKTSIGEKNKILTKSDIFDMIYPVGSVYISIVNTSPASFLGGTWVRLTEGYTLWTSKSDAGSIIDPGLPNITGEVDRVLTGGGSLGGSGAFVDSNRPTTTKYPSTENGATLALKVVMDASKSSSIYGNSNTVQPPAYKVYAWRRTK